MLEKGNDDRGFLFARQFVRAMSEQPFPGISLGKSRSPGIQPGDDFVGIEGMPVLNHVTYYSKSPTQRELEMEIKRHCFEVGPFEGGFAPGLTLYSCKN